MLILSKSFEYITDTLIQEDIMTFRNVVMCLRLIRDYFFHMHIHVTTIPRHVRQLKL